MQHHCVIAMCLSVVCSVWAQEQPAGSGGKPYPDDIAGWTEQDKAAQRRAAAALSADITAAIERKDKTFRIAPGHYRFAKGSPAESLCIAGADGFQIDAAGATFWFDVHSTLRLEDCSQVAVSGLTIDYDPLPFSQATVKAINHKTGHIDALFDSCYPQVLTKYDSLPQNGDGGLSIRFFDPAGENLIKLPWEAVRDFEQLEGSLYRIVPMNNRLLNAADHRDIVMPGCKMTVMQHGKVTVYLNRCREITLSDMTIYASPGFIFYEQNGDGPNRYQNIRLTRRPQTDRLMVSTLDQFHSYLMKHGPVIENCEFSYAGDDFVAVHGFFAHVVRTQEDGRMTLVTTFENDLSKGSVLDFYDLQNGQFLGRAAITELELLDKKEAVRLAAEVDQRRKERGVTGRNFVGETDAVNVTLDHHIAFTGDVVAQCPDRRGAGTVVRKNTFRHGTARGIYVRSNDTIVEKNTLFEVAMSAIAAGPDCYWYESGFADGLVISDNTIINCGKASFMQGLIEPFIGAIHISSIMGQYYPVRFYEHKQNTGIVIRNNRIINPAACGIFLANAKQSVIESNVIESPFAKRNGLSSFDQIQASGQPLKERPFYAIYLIAADDITIRQNSVRYPPEHLLGDIGCGLWTTNIRTD